MPLLSDEAFVVETHPFSDRDVVAVLFTKSHGLRRVVARSARARMSRFAGSLDALNRVAATWAESDGKELGSLREIRLLGAILPAIGTPEAAAVVAWAADHLRSFVPAHEENAALWRLAVHVQEALLAGAPPRLVARYLEIWMLKLSGVFPRTDLCSGCGEPLPERGGIGLDPSGGFRCGSCSTREELSDGARRALGAILRRPLPELSPLGEATEELAELGELSTRVRRAWLGRELVSWPTVEGILA